MAFIGSVARLLSQDAKLLQQGYNDQDTRLFYSDFFDVLVAKEAFGLLQGIDLLVPAVMSSYHQLALDAQAVGPNDATAFETSQEVLALLIRNEQTAPLLDIWPEVRTAQRQDAVLFAFDQQSYATGAFLYDHLSLAMSVLISLPALVFI